MKKSTVKEKTERIIPLPISKFIDTKFRDYAVYVLEARGIPSFYDALTPVQRYILQNTPTSFVKTLSVVGESIKDGYHHGDMSLGKAISRLARPFGSSEQILEGYGFFGTEVEPTAAAARYTQVKLTKKTHEVLSQYKHLTTRDEDGAYDPLWMDIPLGLTSSIIGIAVGYKTTILPRKMKDIQDFLAGKIDRVKPHFQGFGGTIRQYKDLDKAWLISAKIKLVGGNRIEIRELPPIMKYTSALKKLDTLFSEFEGNIRILNNSDKRVIIDIVYRGKDSKEWKIIQDRIKKMFSIVVTETPVFIKDDQVLVYESVEEYLKDYKWQVKRLAYRNTEWERNFLQKELDFNIAKEQFIKFILEKRRSVQEIDIFLKPFNVIVRDRLERLTSKKFTKDELTMVKAKIKELTRALKKKERELKRNQTAFEKAKDPTLKRGVKSQKSKINLLEYELDQINGIEVWGGEDIIDDIEEDEIG